MTDYEELEYEAALDAAREEMIDDALKDISQDGVSYYLWRYGDAIEERIDDLLQAAGQLRDHECFGPSLVCACTAIEVTIRYYLLSPLVQGAFLYEEWADMLAARITSGRAADDRGLIPAIAKSYNVDLMDAKISTGQGFWQFLHERVWPARNKYVHRGDPVSGELASQAQECAAHLRRLAEHIIRSASGRLGTGTSWGSKAQRQTPFA